MNLQQVIEDCGYKTRSYSGRCMYGKECLAYEVSSNELLSSVAKISIVCCVEFVGIDWDSVRWDNMALGMVIYFPSEPYSDNSDKRTCPECNYVGAAEDWKDEDSKMGDMCPNCGCEEWKA